MLICRFCWSKTHPPSSRGRGQRLSNEKEGEWLIQKQDESWTSSSSPSRCTYSAGVKYTLPSSATSRVGGASLLGEQRLAGGSSRWRPQAKQGSASTSGGLEFTGKHLSYTAAVAHWAIFGTILGCGYDTWCCDELLPIFRCHLNNMRQKNVFRTQCSIVILTGFNNRHWKRSGISHQEGIKLRSSFFI